MEGEFSHLPVLLKETIEGLAIDPDGTYLDGTAGGGGHSAAIAAKLKNGRLFSLDKDPDAIRAAGERLKEYKNVKIIKGDFRDAERLLAKETDILFGALLDLGVSSHQLDAAARGFSYRQQGALDMRMSEEGMSAADIVNGFTAEQIKEILWEYGEEKYAPLIARKIVQKRDAGSILTTTDLAEIVASALPPAVRRKEKNPARKTFMALRIAVNDEYEALGEGMEGIFRILTHGGRLCVITFHSSEDRIVKRFFASLAEGCTCPPEFPVCICGKTPKARLVNKKPITATEKELEENRRSRSAKLRILEKI